MISPPKQKVDVVLAFVRSRNQRNLLVAGVLVAVVALFWRPLGGEPVPVDMRTQLIGEYQVQLGPRGGCGGGKPFSHPTTLATITSGNSGLIARNECGDVSPVNISEDRKTIFWYGESARLDTSGSTLSTTDDAGNTWVKVTKQ
jgi:hypothetical protein